MSKLPKRTRGQKIGSQGHSWLIAEIERHPDWLARSQGEDFGVDAEAEYVPGEARGDILKLQFKTQKKATLVRGRVCFRIAGKYLEYARSCRYPFVYVQMDLEREQAWYVWLQKWIFENQSYRATGRSEQPSTTIWVDENQTLTAGLNGELREIAQWRGPTQLALSLLDAFRAATAINNQEVLGPLTNLLEMVAPVLPDAALNDIIEDAIRLGNQLWGTAAGNAVASQLYELVRRFGNRMSVESIDAMVCRGDSYSRVGVNALSLVYDEHFDHARKLNLVEHFARKGLIQVAYFCALREVRPNSRYFDYMSGAGDFQYGGLRFFFDEAAHITGFEDKFANRGPSAILDYLVLVEIP